MNCRYFEHLIVNRSSRPDHPFLKNQEDALREHLIICPSCSQMEGAWRKVDILLQQSAKFTKANITPKPDFTERWMARVEKEQRENERRQLWTSLTFFMSSAGMVFSIMIVWAIFTWGSPITWFKNTVGIVYLFQKYVTAFGNCFGVISDIFSSWELLSIQAVSFATLLFLSAVWLYAINKMSIIKRLI